MTIESERMRSLRRTRPQAKRMFAWRVKGGDLVHTPSAVFEVLSVDNNAPRVEGSRYTTAAYVIDEPFRDGTLVRRMVHWLPGEELVVFRPKVAYQFTGKVDGSAPRRR